MRRLARSIAVALAFAVPILAVAAPADLDRAFGLNGIVVTPAPGILGSQISTLAVQSDGKIVAGGLFDAGSTHFTVWRYTGDGRIDTSFGTGGFVAVPVELATVVAIQRDGKIVVVGPTNAVTQATGGRSFEIGIARLLENGQPDVAFGTGGAASTAIGPSVLPKAVALQQDGKIVVLGYTVANVAHNIGLSFAVARYKGDGGLDSSFGTQGVVVIPITTPTGASLEALPDNLFVLPDGRILAVGVSNGGGQNYFTLVRLGSNGSLDPTFAGRGIVTSEGTTILGSDPGAAIDENGEVLIASLGFRRFDVDGSVDSQFPRRCDARTVSTSTSAVCRFGKQLLAFQPDGKPVTSGQTRDDQDHGLFGVVRLNQDGTDDTTFGAAGGITTRVLFSGIVTALALQDDGKILVGGWAIAADASPLEATLIRYVGDATQISTRTELAIVEFYNPSLDHYFISGDLAEIGALDAGTQIKGWRRTGES
jgi:uncharacterized delta-60 repeat protein